MNPIDEQAVGAETRTPVLARWRWPLMIGGPVIVLAVVAWFILTGGRFQSTDDAYVDVAKAPISAAISGRVIEVDVKENQHVKAGQVLFKLDASDQQAAEERSDAAVAAAALQVDSLRTALGDQQLQLDQAQKTAAFATREAARQKSLLVAGVVSAQQAADAQHTADLAVSQVSIAREQVATAQANLGAGLTNTNGYPGVMQAKAAQRATQVDLAHTVVYAPEDGIVTRVDQLQIGAYVNASQTLFFLLSGEPWVDANFKEDQLRCMRVGQPAAIAVDALGKTLNGRVSSFSPGSGSTFSALPAQNATGNWVKVAQRLPVRISFDKAPPEVAGRAGLSAKVTVDVRSEKENSRC
ncbi:MAG TPA: HlyD family secretion protein [Caulobacteraceae bacterium]|nr:HlyD family secretion protein [Caulobacteraceae bacterium]